MCLISTIAVKFGEIHTNQVYNAYLYYKKVISPYSMRYTNNFVGAITWQIVNKLN